MERNDRLTAQVFHGRKKKGAQGINTRAGRSSKWEFFSSAKAEEKKENF